MKVLLLCSALLFFPFSGWAQNLVVTSIFSAPSSVPALPIGIDISVENRGRTPVSYSGSVAYRFVEPDGRRTLVVAQYGDAAFDPIRTKHDDDTEVYTLAASERRTHFVPVDLDLSGPALFCAPRLLTPGDYLVEVGVEQLSSAAVPERHPGWAEPGGISLGAFVWSRASPLRVRAAEGAEGAALKYALSRGLRPCSWNTFALHGGASDLRRKYPRTLYAAYAAGAVAVWAPSLSREDRRNILTAAAATMESDPVHQWYLSFGALRLKSRDRVGRDEQIDLELQRAASTAPNAFARSLADFERASRSREE